MRVAVTRAIGVDIVRVSRFERMLARGGGFGARLRDRVLHPREHGFTGAQAVAGLWALKEAVFKTLDTADQRRFRFNAWYKCYDKGKPGIRSDEYGKDDVFLASVSHDGDVLVATVLRQVMVDVGGKGGEEREGL